MVRQPIDEPQPADDPVGVSSIEGARIYQSIRARLFDIEDEPLRVGTLRVTRRLGAGGMGEVFLAHDDGLERPVALKLVHAKLSHERRFGERMRREARALAKLAHPNVVHVYEVGEYEGRFFLAMEYIEGQNLGEWIRDSSPAWQAILDAYLAAGEGLVAAHAAGLTHRDFKPENVLRGNDGRICVADFGLARVDPSASHVDSSEFETSFESGNAPSTLDERLSKTGTVMGTPSYMSLEQLRGELVDARSDQFAFCVALYEGLWGAPPFAGRSVKQREAALIQDRPRVPEPSAVPGWVWPILRRGLARDAAQRWPDMRTLLDALRRAPVRRRLRRRRLGVGLALSLAGVGGWWGLTPSGEDPCADQVHALDEVWSDERRAALEAVFNQSETTWGHDNGARVIEQIDRWSQRWIDARVEVCRAEHANPSDSLAARQLECLGQRSDELEVLLGLFADADAALRERAQSSVHGLADPLACEAIAIAGVGIDPPAPEHAEEVAALRRALAEVEALLLSAHWTEALEQSERLLEQAQAIAYVPVEAELRFARARALLDLGSLQASREEFERAVDLAEAARHEHLAIEIWLMLARELAVTRQDPGGGQTALRRLRAKVAANRRQSEYAGDLALVEGHLAVAAGNPGQAEAPLRVAIAQFQQLGRRVDLAQARWVLARALEQLARPDEALEQYRQVRAEVQQIYGAEHPRVAERTRDLGIALLEQGHPQEGRTELSRALAIWAAAPETSQASLLDGHLVLAMLDYQDDQLERARDHARAAEAIARTHADDIPLAMAQVDAAFALIDYSDGEFERAMAAFQRAAEQFEAAQGATDPTSIQTWTGCGWSAVMAGHSDRAELAFARIPLAELASDSNQAISVHLGLAATHLLAGAPEEARRELAGLPAELDPFFARERELIRTFSGEPDDDAIARLRESGATLTGAERREFTALLERQQLTIRKQ